MMSGFLLPSSSSEAGDEGLCLAEFSATHKGFCMPGIPAADKGFCLPAFGSESDSSSTGADAKRTCLTRQASFKIRASSSDKGFLLPNTDTSERSTFHAKIKLTAEVLAVLRRLFTNIRNLPKQAKTLLAASFTTRLRNWRILFVLRVLVSWGLPNIRCVRCLGVSMPT